MRFSASLPWITLSLLRIEPQSQSSIFHVLVPALIGRIANTTNAGEAVHSLNLLNAILTDRVASPAAESLLPAVLASVFDAVKRFAAWDVIGAANRCIVAIIRKVSKKMYASIADQSLTLEQVFAKIPSARQLLGEGIRSENRHLSYIAVLIVGAFNASFTDVELRGHAVSLLGSKSSRVRRAAARAVIALTAFRDRASLIANLVAGFYDRMPFNRFHGNLLCLRFLLDDSAFDMPQLKFPIFELATLPPFVWNDYLTVLKRFIRSATPFNGSIVLNEFYYDQVSLFVQRGFVGQDLSVSGLSALLLYDRAPSDLARKVADVVITPELRDLPGSLLTTGLDFLHAQAASGLDSALLVRLIKQPLPRHVIGNLIGLLKCSKVDRSQLFDMYPLFEDLVFSLEDELNRVHLAISECLRVLLGEWRGYGIALRLVIDDVPRVRIEACRAVCQELCVEFTAEVATFRLIARKLAKDAPDLLMRLALRWLRLLERQAQSDTFGELLLIFVDEFFPVREIFDILGVQRRSPASHLGSIVRIRRLFVEGCLAAVEQL
jgi:hypothetical protein